VRAASLTRSGYCRPSGTCASAIPESSHLKSPHSSRRDPKERRPCAKPSISQQLRNCCKLRTTERSRPIRKAFKSRVNPKKRWCAPISFDDPKFLFDARGTHEKPARTQRLTSAADRQCSLPNFVPLPSPIANPLLPRNASCPTIINGCPV